MLKNLRRSLRGDFCQLKKNLSCLDLWAWKRRRGTVKAKLFSNSKLIPFLFIMPMKDFKVVGKLGAGAFASVTKVRN